ncbi:MAG: MerR family transcriptional regulator [Streptosporangiaceae bacterium]
MDDDRGTRPGLRIGEVARRAGVTSATLRAWEARYGLAPPARTKGGQRLYREADVGRVQAVRGLVDQGWSVAGAVSQVLGQPGRPGEASGEPPGDASVQEGRDAASAAGVLLPGSARRPVLDALAGTDAYAVLATYETARDLLRATEPGQVRDILAGLVRRLGGEVGEAALQDDTVLPVDLAFGEGPPLLPRAPSPSVARMRLEAVLPLVMEDARIVVHRLQLPAPGTPSRAGAKIV